MPNPSQSRLELPADLLPRLRARDERAYKELLELCFAPLARFAFRIVGSRDLAEDVVQDVIIKVVSLGEAFDPKGSLIAYLYASVRNCALNVLRGESRAEQRAQRSVDRYDLPDSSEGFDAIEEFLAHLTERQRSAVYLRFVEQRTIAEVAQILEVSISATEQLISRAIKTLQQKLR